MPQSDTYPDFYSDPEVIEKPREYYELMRSQCPVMREKYHDSLMVTGYEEAMEILNSRDDTYSSVVSTIGPIPPLPFTPEGDDIHDQLEAHRDELPWSAHLVCFDGQKHTDHRALLTSLLIYKRLKANEEYLAAFADRLIDGIVATGSCEVVRQYAHATSTYAICDLMGIPEKDRAELLQLIGAPPSQIDGDAVHKLGPDPLIFLKERFDGYVAERVAQPSGDLMSELTHSKFKDGTRPSPERVAELSRFLFGAGQDTTSRLISMAIRILGDDRELQRRLRDDPSRINDFLEEVLRYDPPVKAVYRLALRDTTVADIEIPAGMVINVSLTGANNDPRQFDEPDRFDIDRPRVRDNIAFSRGKHACPGAPLARIEARVSLERLLARTSDIRISEEHHGPPEARRYAFEPTYSFRNIAELHIEVTPA